ncbi:Hypothetical_protein [Hexamita inflata]|uniref:Hypothetical_protein n=1 Tax=Hexamita inflata TaxID=28002 RepID=A0AA86R101_9EUKA|nr:Hypothetical protein HINF_LOCUS51443 [Hexamita inflata]
MCKQLYVQLNLRRFIWFLSFQNEIVKLEWDKDMPGFGRIFGTWEFGRCLKAIQSQQYSRKICIDENFYFKSDLSPQVHHVINYNIAVKNKPKNQLKLTFLQIRQNFIVKTIFIVQKMQNVTNINFSEFLVILLCDFFNYQQFSVTFYSVKLFIQTLGLYWAQMG